MSLQTQILIQISNPKSILNTIRILVVDDEPDLAPLIKQKFRRQIKQGDLDFSIAHDGIEALEQLELMPEIDIVLTDINMPRMDGLTLLSKLPEAGGMQKAVVVTAYGDMENIRSAMNLGAFDFLTKPIDLGDLETTIRKAGDVVNRERKASLVRETFGRYLSDNVVSTLLDHPEGIKLGGEKRVVTILMSDLRGFSQISETLKPEDVVEMLNIYLGQMTEVITKYGGTIDEFIGDGILTVFGAPVLGETDALSAVACAVAMQLKMDEVNAELSQRGFPNIEMGIGINTGEVVVGNIGSQIRAKYGVVGSNVNLTGRIEAYTVGGQVFISERTLVEGGGEIVVSKSLEVRMKGFQEAIPIYEVEGIGGNHNLTLPSREVSLTDLNEPMKVVYRALDGKHVGDEACDGSLLAVAKRGAMLFAPDGLDVLTNLRVSLDGTAIGVDGPVELYAKVMNNNVTTNQYRIRFTGISEEISSALVNSALVRLQTGADQT